MRILLVEDNPINREVVQGMLEVLGQSADVARDGVEAVEAVRRKRYDLVLMDLHMPRMDGLEATRRIRECEEGKPTRIVALTADVVPERRQALNERGITEFLPKPLSLRELASVLTPEEPPVPHRDSALDRLRQVYAGRPERFSALLQSHRANARRLETEMRAALEAGDAEVLERAAHSLKSSTAMFGSEDVSALAARVEAAARERDLAGARSVLEALPDALAEAEDRLESALL